MKVKPIRYTLMIGAVVLLAGVTVAFAQGGRWHGGGGYGHHWGGPGMMGYGPGPEMGYHDGGRGYGVDLTDEQRDQMQAAREKFHADTEKLRDQIREKRHALNEELAKDAPDAAKAGKLQKELSGLQGEFDQKALQHRLEVREILPEAARKYGGGYGRGPGKGYGRGNCWR